MNNNDNNRRVSKDSVKRPQNASGRAQYEYSDSEAQRKIMLRRRAEKEKRRKMLRRNRIISRIVLAALVFGIIFFAVSMFAKKYATKTPKSSSIASSSISSNSVTSNSAAVASDTPNSEVVDSTSPAPEPPNADAQTAVAGTKLGDWNMILANANNPLPEGFVPQVVKVNVSGHEFDSRAAEALKNMIKDGNATGLELLICSSYRSTERQTKLFNEMKAEYVSKGMTEEEAYNKTKTIRAVPGTSEHETGLATDIVSTKHQSLEESFENTPEFAWLSENAANYGFILRYPREKQTITGIIYEPWHYRYVGVDVAKDIKSKKMCLEEYLETIKQ